ncbi:MAG: flagellar hook assembly protein FlgD [Deltaproteobacteria bacterium]|nr:flagellar hook assembly protein FlgD [Deltaproteobacteria bacterium]
MIVQDVTYRDQEAVAATGRGEVGRDDFLRLLLTQLSYQDPLSPMDSMEFTAQLSQFSQLEQMLDLNHKLDSLLLYQSSLNSWQGVGMIGKEVDAAGDWVELSEGKAGKVGYSLDQDTNRVSVRIYDPGGRLVRTLDLGAEHGGEHLIQWDGRDDNHVPLPDGVYAIEVRAGAGEEARAVPTFVRGVITGLSLEGDQPVLLMGSQEVPFADITVVRDNSGGNPT